MSASESTNGDHVQDPVNETRNKGPELELETEENPTIDSKENENVDNNSETNTTEQSGEGNGKTSQQAENEMEQLTKQLHDTRLDLRSTQDTLKKKDDDLEDLKKQLTDKNKKLSSAKAALKSAEDSMKKKDEDLEELKKQLTDKNKKLSSAKAALKSAEDSMKKKDEDLEELKKQFTDNNKKLSSAKSALESAEDSMKKKDEDLEELKKQLSDKDKALTSAKSELESTKISLKNAVDHLKEKAKDLQETKAKLDQREQELSCLSTELDATKLQLRSKDELCTKQAQAMTEHLSKWNMDSNRREQAEKEADELRKYIAEARGDIDELRSSKAQLFWRLAFRLTYERQLKTKIRGVISAQAGELRTQLAIMTRENVSAQDSHRGEIERLNRERAAERGAWQTQEATLNDRIDELENTKTELEGQVTHCELQVKEKEGSVQIAKVWVQKLSEQCEANKMIRDQLDRALRAEAEKDTQYKETHEQLQREQLNAAQLQGKLDFEKQQRAAMAEAAQLEARNVRQDHERIVVIKEENEKLESTLRDEYKRNEELCEELTKNKSERKKLMANLLSLRRQLTRMGEDKGRLQVRCNHLECELTQSLRNSTPNNTNNGHDQDPNVDLDPALYGLDQLSPVHYSPDFRSRQEAGSWNNMDDSFSN